jgi:histidinol-phosphate aminotransferase
MDIEKLLRENIKQLVPYASARDEFKGEAKVYLDANENAFGSPVGEKLNRYPDPLQVELKEKLSRIKGVPAGNIFLGNGSDEVIDLLYRAFCNPGVDSVILTPPTYGMYEVSANINDVFTKKIPLTRTFQLDIESISEVADERTKLIFICSPNNPTGNSMNRDDVEIILNNFEGIVVIDEAYINYSRHRSFISELTEYPNLVVMQTLSKAWGLAGLRVGMAFASDEIISVLNRIKPPYNIGSSTQELAMKALENVEKVNAWTKQTVAERGKLEAALKQISCVQEVFPSDANFLLVRVSDARGVYEYLVGEGVIVRDRSRVTLCEGCLRITVGTPEENNMLVDRLNNFNA